MKSKFENDLKNKAYESVPDRWDEIKENASDLKLEKIISIKKSINYKPIVVSAASIALVFITAFTINRIHKNKIQSTKCYDKEAMETTVLSFTDENGVEHTTVAYIASGETTLILDDLGNEITIKENGTYAITETQSNSSQSNAPVEEFATETAVIASTSSNSDFDSIPENNTIEFAFPNDFKLNGCTYSVSTDKNGNLITCNSDVNIIKKGYTISSADSNLPTDMTANIYSISNFGTNLAIAVKFEKMNNPIVYINGNYRPSTLGQLLDDIDFENSVTIDGVDLNGTSKSISASSLAGFLSAHKDAQNKDAAVDGRYISVKISCSKLGIINKTIKIYESGYVTMNLTGAKMTFFVGQDTVKSFMKTNFNIGFDDLYTQATCSGVLTSGSYEDNHKED